MEFAIKKYCISYYCCKLYYTAFLTNTLTINLCTHINAHIFLGLGHFCRISFGGRGTNRILGEENNILSFLQQSRKKTPTTGISEFKVRVIPESWICQIHLCYIYIKYFMHVDTDLGVIISLNTKWYFMILIPFILNILLF